MGRRAAVASTDGEAARLTDQELAGELADARLRLGMARNAAMRSGWRKRVLMLEREVADRASAGG